MNPNEIRKLIEELIITSPLLPPMGNHERSLADIYLSTGRTTQRQPEWQPLPTVRQYPRHQLVLVDMDFSEVEQRIAALMYEGLHMDIRSAYGLDPIEQGPMTLTLESFRDKMESLGYHIDWPDLEEEDGREPDSG